MWRGRPRPRLLTVTRDFNLIVGIFAGEGARATLDMQILETERLLPREFVPGDVDALAAVISDPETMRFYREPRDRVGVESWIGRNRRRYQDDGHGLWAMVLKSSGEVVGDCGLTRQNVDGVDDIEIGYHVRRDLWGRGYAPEAAVACRDYWIRALASLAAYLVDPAGQRAVETGGRKDWIEFVEGSPVEGFAALRIRDSQSVRPHRPSGDRLPRLSPHGR